MVSDEENDFQREDGIEDKDVPQSQQFSLPFFALQLQNILPLYIKAERFPINVPVDNMVEVVAAAHTQMRLGEFSVVPETLQAVVHLEVEVSFPQEPRLFAISFKLAGIFSYSPEYQPEEVRVFLQHGSLSILLPSARELLLNLCMRLQVPSVVLPLIQLAQPPFPSSAQEG